MKVSLSRSIIHVLTQSAVRTLTATIAVAVFPAFASSQSPRQEPPAVPVARYGDLPLSFEANQGQSDPSVDFLSHGRGYTLFLRHSEAVLALGADSSAGSTVRMKISGANSNAAIARLDPQITKTNYFIGNNPAKWRTDIPNYSRIRYSSVYDGIDLVYYGNQRRLEHDFIVAPNANPARIVLEIQGAKDLRIDPATGDLVIRTHQSELRLLQPVSYQESGSDHTPIASHYKLLAQNKIGFSIGNYDRTRPLVIDPVLAYSTLLGGSGVSGSGDQANGIAVDAAGNAYITGTTYSANFPTKTSFQSKPGVASGQSTVFVSKLNSTGTALVYSTYLGGTGTTLGGDFGYGIALDSANEAYVVGATYSTDFPITCGALRTVNGAAINSEATTGFVTKLTAAGNQLIYSTYLGGGGNLEKHGLGDVIQAVAVNSTGNAFVTGYTWSTGFPTTAGTFQKKFAGSNVYSNAFVAKLAVGGQSLDYSTYLGGEGGSCFDYEYCAFGNGDFGNAIAIDSLGDAFIAGSTESSTFPVTTGSFQTTLPGAQAAFVTELNPSGTHEIYSTFVGGSTTDAAQAIAVDSSGSAYVAGTTTSSDFPLTEGTVEGAGIQSEAQSVTVNGPVGFLTKLNKAGSVQVYSTYIQGHNTTVTGLAVDSNGAAYLAGTAAAPGAGGYSGFQTTPDALPLPTSQGNSAFLVKLDNAATVFNYATLFGGGANDNATSLAMDPFGNVYVAGYAKSPDFPTTAGAFQTKNKAALTGGSNAFVSMFAVASEANQTIYPALPSGIATSITDISGYWGTGFDWSLALNATLNTGIPGPPPTGTFTVTLGGDPDSRSNQDPFLVQGSFGGTTQVNLYLSVVTAWVGDEIEIDYPGDSVYQPSSATGTATIGPCEVGEYCPPGGSIPPDQGESVRINRQHTAGLQAGTKSAAPLNQTAPKIMHLAPKFLPPAPPAHPETLAANVPSPETAPESVCIAQPALTVMVHNSSRIYGSANPTFGYSLTGLVDGNTAKVTPTTTATTASPAGSYPITATVTGAAIQDYSVKIIPGTLTVEKATLQVTPSPATRGVTYGQPIPSMTGFSVTGLLNGDTQSTAVSGAVALSTTATSTSPAGIYSLNIAAGTLVSTNYKFLLAPGRFYIYRAPLIGTIQNVTIHRGDPIPAFTYKLTGFVNGDTQSSAVFGQPILSTKATSFSPPGKYQITGALGTLASANYSFVPVNGILTILP